MEEKEVSNTELKNNLKKLEKLIEIINPKKNIYGTVQEKIKDQLHKRA